MDRRIFGIENEYGVTCTFDGQRRLTPDEVARYLFRKVVSWGRSSNVFLGNGSRLYLDVGSHPEYATPECDDVREAVIHDKAGERIIEGLVEDAQQRLAEEGIPGEIYVFKNNTDSAGNSYGCHENYCVGRAGEFQKISDVLIPFLVSRQITCGAGKVATSSAGAKFCVSQRADHIWEGVSSATTRSRPIINTRDEPHADAEKYRRLHVIVGDSNMSETTTLLKLGSADLVLRMIEAGVVMRDMALENPIRAIREISHDITGRKVVAWPTGASCPPCRSSGSTTSGRCLRRARGDDRADPEARPRPVGPHASTRSSPATFPRRHRDRLDHEVPAHHALHREERPVARHPRVLQLDLAYHDINRRRGLFYLLQRRGLAARVCSDIETFHAKVRPPQTTRAKLRGDFIRAAQEHRRDFTVDWVHLKLNDQAQRTVLCKDPFASEDSRVMRLIDSM